MKNIIRGDKRYVIKTKGTIHQGHKNSKCFTLNNKASFYSKQNVTELKGEKDKSTIITGDVNIPF